MPALPRFPRRWAGWAAGAALVFGGPARGPAQSAPPPPPKAEIATRESGFTFRSRVNLVTVPVVVRDAEGRALGNLAREDFQIADNGKPQVVSKFSVETFGETAPAPVPAAAPAAPAAPPPPAPPAMPERYVAFFIDDLNTQLAELAQARAAAWRYLQHSLHASERVAIATSSGLTTLDFTDDRDRLRQTLLAIRPRAGIVQNSVDCPPMTIYMADLIVNKYDPTALGAAVADYQTCANSSMSGNEAAFAVTNFAKLQINLAERNVRSALGTLDGLIRKLSVMAGQRAIVMVSSGFLVLDDRREDELEVMERAIRANIVVNSLDARALYATIPGGEAADRSFSADPDGTLDYTLGEPSPTCQGCSAPAAGGPSIVTKMQYQNEEALANRGVMAEFAASTGGRFFENSNDLDAGFERLAAAPEYLYMLGFNPQDLKLDGKYHTLKVTVPGAKGVSIEARHGYFAPRYASDPGERSKGEIQDAFFSRDEMHDIPLAIQTQFFKTGDYAATLTVTARIDVRKLRFRKEEDRNRNDVTIVAGLFDSDGNYVSGLQKVLELRLLDATLENRLGSGIAVRNTFQVSTGSYLVRLVVRDAEGETMAAQSARVEIP